MPSLPASLLVLVYTTTTSSLVRADCEEERGYILEKDIPPTNRIIERDEPFANPSTIPIYISEATAVPTKASTSSTLRTARTIQTGDGTVATNTPTVLAVPQTSQPSNSTTQPTTGGLTGPQLAGLGVGCGIAGVLLLGALVLWACLRRRRILSSDDDSEFGLGIDSGEGRRHNDTFPYPLDPPRGMRQNPRGIAGNVAPRPKIPARVDTADVDFVLRRSGFPLPNPQTRYQYQPQDLQFPSAAVPPEQIGIALSPDRAHFPSSFVSSSAVNGAVHSPPPRAPSSTSGSAVTSPNKGRVASKLLPEKPSLPKLAVVIPSTSGSGVGFPGKVKGEERRLRPPPRPTGGGNTNSSETLPAAGGFPRISNGLAIAAGIGAAVGNGNGNGLAAGVGGGGGGGGTAYGRESVATQFEEDALSAAETMHSAKTPGGGSKVGVEIGFAYTPKQVVSYRERMWPIPMVEKEEGEGVVKGIEPPRARTAPPAKLEMAEREGEREVRKSRSYGGVVYLGSSAQRADQQGDFAHSNLGLHTQSDQSRHAQGMQRPSPGGQATFESPVPPPKAVVRMRPADSARREQSNHEDTTHQTHAELQNPYWKPQRIQRPNVPQSLQPAAPSRKAGTWTARPEPRQRAESSSDENLRRSESQRGATVPLRFDQTTMPASEPLWSARSEPNTGAKVHRTDSTENDRRQRTPRSAREKPAHASLPRRPRVQADPLGSRYSPEPRQGFTDPHQQPESYYQHQSDTVDNSYQPAQVYQVYHDKNHNRNHERKPNFKAADSGSITSIESAAQVEHDFHETSHQQELSPVVESPPASAGRSPVKYPRIPGVGMGMGMVSEFGSPRKREGVRRRA